MATLITKNSSTASSVPTNAQLVQGELAVNVTDKRLYTENASGTVVELGTNPGSAVTHTAGTAGAPAITTTGDTNTGIFFPAADTVAASTGGAERLRLDSSGNLGLGVTPSAWFSSAKVFQIGNGLSLWSSGNTNAALSQNLYLDATATYRWITANPATNFNQSNGAFTWQLAAGTPSANGAIGSFTTHMTLDASGNLGIGTTSPRDVAGYVSLGLNDTTGSLLDFYANGTRIGGVVGVSGNMQVGTATAIPLIFNTDTNERARITSGGNLLVGTTSGIVAQTGVTSTHNISTNVDTGYGLTVSNTSGAAFGLGIKYTAHSPNNAGNSFVWCSDGGGTQRASIYSNGGLANYSGNNVNLSDRREKTNFAPAKDYLDTICAIPVQTFNYIDQSEDDPGTTLGVVAQDVQAVAPELVMESNWGTKEDPKMRLSIYQTDLQYALMKALQELNAKVESLTTELNALKGT